MHSFKVLGLAALCFTLQACGLEDTAWCKGTVTEGECVATTDSTADAGTVPDAGEVSCDEWETYDRDQGKCVLKDSTTPDAGTETDAGTTFRWYYDGDGDGVPVSGTFYDGPSAPPKYVAEVEKDGVVVWDCDDANPGVSPLHTTDICGDGLDNDCDGQVDEGCSASCTLLDWFRDADDDGYPVLSDKMQSCQKPSGYIAARADGKWDCDDANASRNPGATEVPNNGIDEDCNPANDTTVPTGTKRVCLDADGDGYPSNAPGACVDIPSTQNVQGYIPVRSDGEWDCADNDADVHPGKTEVLNNGKDDDCDPTTLDVPNVSTETCYRDQDSDGFGKQIDTKTVATGTACESGYIKARSDGKWDCNDTDASIKPGATELCDGVDNDCSGAADEPYAVGTNCAGQYGLCRVTGKVECASTTTVRCSVDPGGSQSRAVTEIPNDGIDQDCDGSDLITTTSPTTVTDGFRYTTPSGYVVLSGTVSQCADQACTSFTGGILAGTASGNTFTFSQVRNRGQGARYYRVNVNLATSAGGTNSSWSCLGSNTVNGSFDQTGSVGATLTTPVGTVSNGGGGCEVVLRFQDN